MQAPSVVYWQEDGEGFTILAGGYDVTLDNPLTSQTAHVPIIAGGGCLGMDIVGSATPCAPGDSVNMSAHTPGVVDFGIGKATFGGQTYSDVDLQGQFTFDAAPRPFPAGATGNPFIMSEAFTFFGTLSGTSGGESLFDLALMGTGTTERNFWNLPQGYDYQLESAVGYTFDTAGATTPEPASVLLLLTGITGMAFRRRPRAD